MSDSRSREDDSPKKQYDLRRELSSVFRTLCGLNLVGSTVLNALITRYIFKPTAFTFIFAWPASELVHFIAFMQASNLLLLNYLSPTIYDGILSKIVLLFNFYVFSKQTRAFCDIIDAKTHFDAALRSAKIEPRSGSSKLLFYASLLPLFAIGRRGRKLQITSAPYSKLKVLDPQLLDDWKRLPINLKRAYTYTGRDEIKNWTSLDVITLASPSASIHPLPILMYIHGGGWATGSKFFSGGGTLSRVASRGVIVVSINYRLAPERAFPAQIVDCKRALIYIRKNCTKWNGDPNKIFVSGESAGGHLSALLAVTANFPAFQPPEDPFSDTSVAGAIPVYGVMDWTDKDGHLEALHPPLMDGLQGGMLPFIERVVVQKPFQEHLHDYEVASPTYHVRRVLDESSDPKFCPFMVVHGTRDALAAFNDSKTFFDSLQNVRKKFGQPADIFVRVPGG